LFGGKYKENPLGLMPIISNKIKRILIPTARGIFRLFKMPDCSSLAVDDFGSDRWNRLWKDDCVAAVCQARLLPDQLRCHCPNGYSHGSNDCRRGSRPIWNRCDYCRWESGSSTTCSSRFFGRGRPALAGNLIHPRLFEHWKTAFAAALEDRGSWKFRCSSKKASRIGLISRSVSPLIPTYNLPGWSSADFLHRSPDNGFPSNCL